MLSKILVASAGVLLLVGCQQNQAVTTPPPAPPPASSYTVFFDTGKSTLSPESMSTIAQAANAYKVLRGQSVAVSGHTDTTGPAAYNQQLSRQRAAAVSNELLKDGVPQPAIAAMGYGETNLPVQTGQDVAERRNRSVDIAISDRGAAQLMSDSQYCTALSRLYRRYRTAQIDETAAAAMYQCETANVASAIPVLEQALNAMKIPLPART
jgi:hypothetical protein